MSERKGTKALELWCKRLVKDCPDVHIDNMTTSWRNGIAFCALVHHFRPDLIDMSTLKPENVYENNQLAFSIAEKHLGIPSLLDPEDMVENEVPDRLSILTYLSQFYQRLGHTVHIKSTEIDSKLSSPSSTQTTAPIKFGKTGLDKCAACGLPVYLAQRLIISHKLYHRRCFRCSKCSGNLNPNNFEVIEGSDFHCDSCKNEKTIPKFLNNNDQMGMLAFNDDLDESKPAIEQEPAISIRHRPKSQSVLEKISMFENNQDNSIVNNLGSLTLKESIHSNFNESKTPSDINITSGSGAQSESLQQSQTETVSKSTIEPETINIEAYKENESSIYRNIPEKVYKSNINKFNFLQTQLSDNTVDNENTSTSVDVIKQKTEDTENITEDIPIDDIDNESSNSVLKEDCNIIDDMRLPKEINLSSDLDCSIPLETSKDDQEIGISVPPRRKKINTPEKVSSVLEKPDVTSKLEVKKYPDNLNPFSDDEEEDEKHYEGPARVSTNPFGSTDEEDDEVPPIQRLTKVPSHQNVTPTKRLIAAQNPFWSDGEEPSSDEEGGSSLYNSSIATSTPNLPAGTPRRKKAKAPPPPRVVVTMDQPCTSLDDVASISSLSSYNSTIHSDQKSWGKSTPMLPKRHAPTPPDSLSTVSGSTEKVDMVGSRGNTSDAGRKKGPAPGLPLPERREVKMAMSPEELQVQLDLLETQQLGLERQGVLIEQMIRDKCEGDEATIVPQEEVEDLVIQLCELVNEKNDLFRKQTELMYIRRQQRLEQEQADIEHEIRVLQSRPAVNRIDADKAREEQLVSRLVQIVRLRDELVQQIDAERRRERQEDLAIAASIASKRAQRSSESNSSSLKSAEVVATPKKNKVKDKVKKQLKKAKHSLISKKKDDSGEHKKEKLEKSK